MDIAGINLDQTSTIPLYRQLERALAEAITTGSLRAGDRLPSERDLAGSLGVSRTTAVNAYRELESRGLTRGRVGRGAFVCAAGDRGATTPFAWQGKVALAAQRTIDPTLRTMVRDHDATMISFAGGMPALDRFPVAAFHSVVARVLERDPGAAFGLGPTEGQPRFREAVARRHGVPTGQVLALSGSQQGLDLIARCLLDPGDAVVMDRPGYIARADPAELEHVLERCRPKLLSTNPTFHNPTSGTRSLDLRRDMLRLAARYRLAVVEDEPYRELHFRTPPPPTLLELDEHISAPIPRRSPPGCGWAG